MLAKRIIPCLDVACGRVVKGIKFENLTDVGSPAAMGEFYNNEGADELVFLDISASFEGRKTMVQVAQEVADRVFIPFTIGGGINSTDDISALLGAGADKVSINTSAVFDPGLVANGAEKFGSQCIVVAIDARRGASGWEVYTHGGRKGTGMDAVRWAVKAAELGAGEILLTSMDEDGMNRGYDIELTRAVAEAVDIPVIASGGAGSLDDFRKALVDGKADAALAASVFHYGIFTIRQVKCYLDATGVPVRKVYA